MFVVDTNTPGYVVSKKLKKLGHHTSETAVLAFENMRVPASALLGGSEGGFAQVTGTLEGGRITHAARSVGVSQAAFETALKYAGEREQFGQKIGKFQAIKFKLARMAVEVETARTMVWRAAWLSVRPGRALYEGSGDGETLRVGPRSTWREALQIHGGYGYITEFPSSATSATRA
jgi:alkylation response protein AidB-like acyl-CoA dehydrogenase